MHQLKLNPTNYAVTIKGGQFLGFLFNNKEILQTPRKSRPY